MENVFAKKNDFEKAEDFMMWDELQKNALDLTDAEEKLILGYVEGHGYEIRVGSKGSFLLLNRDEPENEPEVFYDITDLMARINQWNYEFLLDDTVTGDWRESVKRDASIIADLQERLCFVRGHYIGTPTVKELIAILSKLPQDYRVTCCGGENYLYRFEGNKYITIDHEEFLEV